MLRRSVMTLYSGHADIYSHQVRIVLAEKGVSVDVLNVQADQPCKELLELNPYNEIPTLIDRDVVLYRPGIIMEYLDERFPHPPLLPVYPVARAKNRLMMHRIDQDWYSLYHKICTGSVEEAERARQELRQGFIALVPVFAEMPYFLSEEFSLVDCCLGPLLWRFPSLGIELSKQAKPILKYVERIFKREAFQASLTEAERELGNLA